MDNSDYLGNRHDDRLGVNKFGKAIRKSPPHQPNLGNPARQAPQPQVYNINKNDFRNIVQQLTGSPSRYSQEPLPRPPQNPAAMRLQKVRPPNLAPINVNRPQMPMPPRGSIPFNNNNNFPRPYQYGQPPPQAMAAPSPSTADSPISAYMRYLQHSIARPPPPLPSPRTSGPLIPPSPSSPFIMPSPSGYVNLISPLSPYPLLSPGYPPFTPNFTFSPMAQSGPQPPLSPGLGFPSPGFFQIPSPRWRN